MLTRGQVERWRKWAVMHPEMHSARLIEFGELCDLALTALDGAALSLTAIVENPAQAERIMDLEREVLELTAKFEQANATALDAESVRVPKPAGMRKPLEVIGKRLLDFYRNRFALVEPVLHTDNERQVLVAALKLLQDALAAQRGG